MKKVTPNIPQTKKMKKAIIVTLRIPLIELTRLCTAIRRPWFFGINLRGRTTLKFLRIFVILISEVLMKLTIDNKTTTKSSQLQVFLKYDLGPLNMKPFEMILSKHSIAKMSDRARSILVNTMLKSEFGSLKGSCIARLTVDRMINRKITDWKILFECILWAAFRIQLVGERTKRE